MTDTDEPSTAPHPLVDLLGPTLARDEKAGDEISVTDLAPTKKNVLLYFSAYWCGPCRGFTPLPSKVYAMYKRSSRGEGDADANEGGCGFEVVFVS